MMHDPRTATMRFYRVRDRIVTAAMLAVLIIGIVLIIARIFP